jgi:NCS2 family nucleobase:cation symporter-2
MAFVLLSLVPAAAVVFATIPAPVIGAAMFFTAAFVFTSGLQMITARLLDSRKIIVIGFSFAMAVIADVSHDLLSQAPLLLHPILDNALVLGTFSAVLLNLFMRIGVRQRVTIKLDAGHVNRDTIERFLTEQGGRWGARRDIINRAIFGVVQLLEVVGDVPEGTEIEASFDEFNLDVRVRYKGATLMIPERKPTPREIIASEEGERVLAGYLLRRSADRINCKTSGTMAEVQLHYDH